jgi:hypothetical protein
MRSPPVCLAAAPFLSSWKESSIELSAIFRKGWNRNAILCTLGGEIHVICYAFCLYDVYSGFDLYVKSCLYYLFLEHGRRMEVLADHAQ